MIKNIKSIFAILRNKNGFFMPSIILYTIFMFSFIIVQTIQISQNMLLVKNEEKILQIYKLKKQAIEFVKKDLKNSYHFGCVIPTTYDTLKGQNYEISIKRNCIRKPGDPSQDLTIKENKLFRSMDNLITKRHNPELLNNEYKLRKAAIATLSSLEIAKGWIGVPIELEMLNPEELAVYLLILELDFYYYYSIDLKFENIENHLIIGGPENGDIEYLFYT